MPDWLFLADKQKDIEL